MSSQQAVADEERKDVLAILEGKAQAQAQAQAQAARARGSASSLSPGREPSPKLTPRSPVRSMLDIAEDSTIRHGSIAGTNGGITRPTAPRHVIRSMLDIDAPAPPAAISMSAHTSPTSANHRSYVSNGSQHRSLSDAAAASRPADFGPRSNVLETKTTNPSTAYQFAGILPSNPGGPVVPKRNTQAGKKNSLPSAMSEVVRGGDIGLFGSRDRGRNHSIAGTGISTAKSRSPHGLRSGSPHTSAAGNDSSNIHLLENGETMDMNLAYRRLSDANLALSGGALSSLAGKSRSRNNSDANNAGNNRLQKDYLPIDGEEALADSSDDDATSSDENRRGRKGLEKARGSDTENKNTTLGMGRAKGPKPAPKSQMAAAEEERMFVFNSGWIFTK
ncbi:hypothetical protein M7I_4089 [Glarea lozoyensis 74030]|uniref:Uncharacterized protein n=1 Tax=Glarea lozoyensis (strain ATCC 74030 / MF5533) TaxID=1104152 RepID=H0EN86_GLAL7|nr:hypothetical protein M7I_4089 [Glarea lozoyensis 74030]